MLRRWGCRSTSWLLPIQTCSGAKHTLHLLLELGPESFLLGGQGGQLRGGGIHAREILVSELLVLEQAPAFGPIGGIATQSVGPDDATNLVRFRTGSIEERRQLFEIGRKRGEWGGKILLERFLGLACNKVKPRGWSSGSITQGDVVNPLLSPTSTSPPLPLSTPPSPPSHDPHLSSSCSSCSSLPPPTPPSSLIPA